MRRSAVGSDAMSAEFDTVAEWTAEVATDLGSDHRVPAGCRGSGNPAALDWLIEHLGLSAGHASIVYGIAGGVDMLVFYPAGKVMDVRGRRWVTVPSMVVMGLSLLAIPLTSGAVSLTVVSCILGFGNGIGAGMVMTLGADYSPDIGRAQFLGIWRELSDLGAVGGPALLSGVTAAVALGPAIAATGVVGLVAAGVLWKYVPAKPGART